MKKKNYNYKFIIGIIIGLIAVGGYEAMEKLFHPHDNYMILATLKADGTVEER